MADETTQPPKPPAADEPEHGDAQGASPRADDKKSASPGFESVDAGSLPPPPALESGAKPPTPESQAAQTGKAPSGSSSSGTTVPASSGETEPTATVPPPQSTAAPKAQPPGGASPATADAEKAAKIAEAKARAAAAKQAAGEKLAPGQPAATAGAAAGAPKAPVKKKEEGPKPTDASNHPLVKRIREKLDGAVREAFEFIGQLSIHVAPTRIVETCELLKRDAETPFNYLSDLTCVHYPDRDAPFEIVYNLFSIKTNERVRLKVAVGEDEEVLSVTGVWPAANWMEREVYDLFGVRFRHHPDLRRLLLPPDWEGHPLRKDYPLEFMENDWTAKHLPEFSEVQKEQLDQRRGYGLEALSTGDIERRVREIFRGGKEVMAKDK